MADIFLTNSLSGKKEKFEPIKQDEVGVYTCGPTVYDHATIGNFRTYTVADILYRALEFNGFKTKYVMNLTDVGHLVGDVDVGGDTVEKHAGNNGKAGDDDGGGDYHDDDQALANMAGQKIAPTPTTTAFGLGPCVARFNAAEGGRFDLKHPLLPRAHPAWKRAT